MSFDKKNGESFCERCGYEWKTKSFDSPREGRIFIEPRSCAKCKSKVWNQPRTYGGKWLNGNYPMARRWKTTGRAAIKLKTEQYKFRNSNFLKCGYCKKTKQDCEPSFWKGNICQECLAKRRTGELSQI
jgi:hypothetical protein